MKIKGQQPNLVYPVTLITLVLIIAVLPGILFKSLLTALYIILTALLIGKTKFSNVHESLQLLLGLSTVIATIVISGTFLFYASIPISELIIYIIFSIPLLFTISAKQVTLKMRANVSAFAIASLVPLAACFYIVASHQNTQSLVSPWVLIPGIFFLVYMLTFMFFILIGRSEKKVSWIWFIPVFFLALGIVSIMFPLGFGFDPFIHQASEKLLLHTGSISPKPLYYVGYYILTVVISTITRIPIDSVDRYIVPVVGSILLPLSLISVYQYLLRKRSHAYLAAVAFLLFPLPFLVQSTPQSLSFLLAIILVIIAQLLQDRKIIPVFTIFLLSITVALIHPLTGIPCILFSILLLTSVLPLSKQTRAFISSAIIFCVLIAVPLALYIAGARSPEFSASIQYTPLSISSLLPRWISFVRLDDLLYLLQQLYVPTIIVLVIAGFRQAGNQIARLPYMAMSVALLLSAGLSATFLHFSFPNSEQSTFATRLLILSFIFSLPFTLRSLLSIFEKIFTMPYITRLGSILLIAMIASTSLYFSYPRFDTRSQHKGYSASAADYEVVQYINMLQDDPYIVLANQTVSGVALQQFGFVRYYNNLFYYPIPTTSELYDDFLAAMKTDASLPAILDSVESKTGIRNIFIVLNSYWSEYDQLKENLGQQADIAYVSTDKTVTVFHAQ